MRALVAPAGALGAAVLISSAASNRKLYVARLTSSDRTFRRIELEPGATRVITGPIGSGKSTELIVIARAHQPDG